MKEIYQLNKEELFRTCGNPEGLTTTDAKERLQTYGENTLVEQKKQSVASVFFHQFADLLVIILIAAAIVSMASGNIESTIVIFAVIIMNAILGTIQYVKAEKSLDSLKELSAPKAKVLRDGIKQEIASKDIVPGDILLLEAGDMIVADGRIIGIADVVFIDDLLDLREHLQMWIKTTLISPRMLLSVTASIWYSPAVLLPMVVQMFSLQQLECIQKWVR